MRAARPLAVTLAFVVAGCTGPANSPKPRSLPATPGVSATSATPRPPVHRDIVETVIVSGLRSAGYTRVSLHVGQLLRVTLPQSTGLHWARVRIVPRIAVYSEHVTPPPRPSGAPSCPYGCTAGHANDQPVVALLRLTRRPNGAIVHADFTVTRSGQDQLYLTAQCLRPCFRGRSTLTTMLQVDVDLPAPPRGATVGVTDEPDSQRRGAVVQLDDRLAIRLESHGRQWGPVVFDRRLWRVAEDLVEDSGSRQVVLQPLHAGVSRLTALAQSSCQPCTRQFSTTVQVVAPGQ
jgi:hypothetical protein